MGQITGTEPINPSFDNEGNYRSCIGLTIRQHFASLALQGLCALPDKGEFKSNEEAWEKMVQYSVLAADKLIEELNKPNP